MSNYTGPCEYCGTMLDEDGREESDIPAVGTGPVAHHSSVCRERVHAALRYMQREARTRDERIRALREVLQSAVDPSMGLVALTVRFYDAETSVEEDEWSERLEILEKRIDEVLSATPAPLLDYRQLLADLVDEVEYNRLPSLTDQADDAYLAVKAALGKR